MFCYREPRGAQILQPAIHARRLAAEWRSCLAGLLRVAVEFSHCVGILILYTALLSGIAPTGASAGRELPMHAIVNGHTVQPRDDQLRALGYSDLGPQKADEVDRLYRQLMSTLPDNPGGATVLRSPPTNPSVVGR
jgi:hypothetical protein